MRPSQAELFSAVEAQMALCMPIWCRVSAAASHHSSAMCLP